MSASISSYLIIDSKIETNTIFHFMFDIKLPGGSGLGLAQTDRARARQKKGQQIEIYQNPLIFFGTVEFPTQYR